MGFFDWFKCGRCKELEAKLFAEIDSNRLREDEQSRIIAQLAGARTLPGGRTPLGPQPKPEPDVLDDDELTPNQEQLIAMRVEEIVSQAPSPYTKDDREKLEKIIRANPDKYL